MFDTALDDFNFAQLFSENRYLGNDRVGDANQLTLAVTSRLLDPDDGRGAPARGRRPALLLPGPAGHAERGAALGRHVRFPARRRGTALRRVGAHRRSCSTTSTRRRSSASTPGSATRRRPAGSSARATAIRGSSSTRSTGQSELNQFDLPAQWPVTENWTLLGRWNYSLLDRKTLEAVGGVEYNAGCWVLRLVGQRLTTTTQTTTNSIFVQLELNGLARFGTSPLDLLRRSVPGYLRTNDPTRVAARPQRRFLPRILRSPHGPRFRIDRIVTLLAASLTAVMRAGRDGRGA